MREPQTVTWTHEGRWYRQRLRYSTDGLEPLGEVETGDMPLETPEPQEASPGVVRKAWNLTRAMASLAAQGPAGDLEQRRRRLACTGRVRVLVQGVEQDQQLGRSCPRFKRDDADGQVDGYCQACGCPEWRGSRMAFKWTIPEAPCPLGRY